MSVSPITPAIRIVPGAPPPAPVSRSQKKKQKKTGSKKSSDQPEEQSAVPDAHTAALIEHAPSESDVREGSLAPELVARTDSAGPVSPGGVDETKSPVIEMLNKRLKASNKKIVSTQCCCRPTPYVRALKDVSRFVFKATRLRRRRSSMKTRSVI